MSRWIPGLLVLVFVLVVWGVPRYLGPDDLARCPSPSPGSCAAADGIVVVSGGDTNARVMEGVRLYKKGWAPRLVFSGAAADETGLSNALAMKKLAVQLGVSESAIATDEYSQTTAENARNTSRMIEQAGMKRVILVTSGYHQRRVSLEFHRHVSTDVVLLNHPVAEDRQWSGLWWASPVGWWLAASEGVKVTIFYVFPEAGL